MAKKKGKELTLEEKLEQALVPREDWPYEVPENWCWTYMKNVARWGSGGTPSRKHIEYYNGNIPWIKTGELNNQYIYDTEEKITEEAIRKSSAKIFPQNSVIIAMYGATIGKVGILGIPATTNQACACAESSIAIYYKYLFFYALSQREVFIAEGKGGAQPNISQNVIKNHRIPLPPLPEQQRIVECIENLYAKLDEAKEMVQAVLDESEKRKAAILHKAFSGELTEKWRNENKLLLDEWKQLSVKEVCTSLKYGTSAKSKDKGKAIVIRMGNLQKGEIDWSKLAYTDNEEEIEKYKLSSGDVLFNRTNSPELVGKTAIYRGEYPAIYAGYLIKLDYKRDILIGEYLNYILNSPVAKEYCNSVKTDGVNQSNINAQKIGAFVIPVPNKKEQEEIVSTLDNIFAKEKVILETAEKSLEHIDSIKKSILAKAFRGELGTNDLSEPTSMELLKEIL